MRTRNLSLAFSSLAGRPAPCVPQAGEVPPSCLVGLRGILLAFTSGATFGGCLHRGLLASPGQYQVHLAMEVPIPWGHPSAVGRGRRPIGRGRLSALPGPGQPYLYSTEKKGGLCKLCSRPEDQ